MKSSILPLYESILSILNLWGRIKEIAHGKPLSEIIKETPNMKLIFTELPVYRLLGAKYYFLKL
jgi:hypothetical protein